MYKIKKNKNLNLLQIIIDTCWFNCLFNQLFTDVIAEQLKSIDSVVSFVNNLIIFNRIYLTKLK